MEETLEILILVTLDVSRHKSDITMGSGYSQIGYSNTQQFLAPLAVSADAITDLHQTVIRLIFSCFQHYTHQTSVKQDFSYLTTLR